MRITAVVTGELANAGETEAHIILAPPSSSQPPRQSPQQDDSVPVRNSMSSTLLPGVVLTVN